MKKNLLHSLLLFFALSLGADVYTHYTLDNVLNLIEESNTTITEKTRDKIQKHLAKHDLNNNGILHIYINDKLIRIGHSKIEDFLVIIENKFNIKTPSMCPLCFSLANKLIHPKKCRHEFCQDCLVRYYANKNVDEKNNIRNHRRCPMCKKRFGNTVCETLGNDSRYKKYRKEAKASQLEIIAQAIEDDEEFARQLAQQFQDEADAELAERIQYDISLDESEHDENPASPQPNFYEDYTDDTSETI